MSTNTPKIFTQPKEKRTDQTQPLIVAKHHILEPLHLQKNNSTKCVEKTNSTGKKIQCMARVSNGNQCNRLSKDEHTDYCGCHAKHRPYGRFDGPVEGKKFLNVPKKRGPRFKNTKEYTLDELDPDLYVQTQLVQIDENFYLIDKHGVLYSNDTICDIIGRQEGDYITWFV